MKYYIKIFFIFSLFSIQKTDAFIVSMSMYYNKILDQTIYLLGDNHSMHDNEGSQLRGLLNVLEDAELRDLPFHILIEQPSNFASAVHYSQDLIYKLKEQLQQKSLTKTTLQSIEIRNASKICTRIMGIENPNYIRSNETLTFKTLFDEFQMYFEGFSRYKDKLEDTILKNTFSDNLIEAKQLFDDTIEILRKKDITESDSILTIAKKLYKDEEENITTYEQTCTRSLIESKLLDCFSIFVELYALKKIREIKSSSKIILIAGAYHIPVIGNILSNCDWQKITYGDSRTPLDSNFFDYQPFSQRVCNYFFDFLWMLAPGAITQKNNPLNHARKIFNKAFDKISILKNKKNRHKPFQLTVQ